MAFLLHLCMHIDSERPPIKIAPLVSSPRHIAPFKSKGRLQNVWLILRNRRSTNSIYSCPSSPAIDVVVPCGASCGPVAVYELEQAVAVAGGGGAVRCAVACGHTAPGVTAALAAAPPGAPLA